MLLYLPPALTDGCSDAADGKESEAAAFAGRHSNPYSETAYPALLTAAQKAVHPNPAAALFHLLHTVESSVRQLSLIHI